MTCFARALRLEAALVWGDGRFAVMLLVLLVAGLQASLLFGGLDVARLASVCGSGDPSELPLNAGNLFVLVNAGMWPFDPDVARFFILDMTWASPYVVLSYVVCSAFASSARKLSSQVVLRLRSRLVLAASELFRVVAISLALFVCELIAGVFVSLVAGGSPSLVFSVGDDLGAGVREASVRELFLTYASVAVSLVAFSLFLSAVSAEVGPTASLVVAVAFIVAAGYFQSSVIFLGGSMTVRGGLASGDWSFVLECLAVCAGVSILSVLWVLLRSRKAEYI